MRAVSIAILAAFAVPSLFAEDHPVDGAGNVVGVLSDTSSYKEVMGLGDSDKDGVLSPEEIAAVVHAGTKAKLQSFDVDGDGALGKNELATLRQNWRADKKPNGEGEAGEAKPKKKPKGEAKPEDEADGAKPGKKPKGEAQPEGDPGTAQPGD